MSDIKSKTPYVISFITGDTKDQFQENILSLEEGMMPLSEIVEVDFSKLGLEEKTAFLQIFGRLKDYIQTK